MNADAQVKRILTKLRRKEIVSQPEANNWHPPIGRVAARIKDLRIAGYNIETTKHPNQGRGTHGRYSLIKEATDV